MPYEADPGTERSITYVFLYLFTCGFAYGEPSQELEPAQRYKARQS